MKKNIFIIAILLYQMAFAELSNIPGAFTDVGYSAKSISMGFTQANLNQNAMSTILNPANLMNQTGKHSVVLNSFKLRNLDNYLVMAYSTKMLENIPLGVMMITSGDDIWNETQIGISAGYQIFEGFNLGITSKILTVSAGNNANGQLQIGDSGELQVSGSGFGFGLDFGLQYQIEENQLLAVVVKNLFSTIGYSSEGGGGNAKGDYSEGIPGQYTLGYSVSNNSLSLLIDIVDGFGGDNPTEIRMGSDWNLYKEMLFVRTGFRTELMTGENKMYGLGTGININPGNIGLELNLGYFFRPNFVDMNELRLELGFNLK